MLVAATFGISIRMAGKLDAVQKVELKKQTNDCMKAIASAHKLMDDVVFLNQKEETFYHTRTTKAIAKLTTTHNELIKISMMSRTPPPCINAIDVKKEADIYNKWHGPYQDGKEGALVVAQWYRSKHETHYEKHKGRTD